MEPPHWPQSATTTFPLGESLEPGDEQDSSRAHCQYHSLSLLHTDPASQPPVPEAEEGAQGASAQAGFPSPPPLLFRVASADVVVVDDERWPNELIKLLRLSALSCRFKVQVALARVAGAAAAAGVDGEAKC